MRYQPLSSEFYKKNRKKLNAKLPEDCVAIFHSNDIMPTNADGEMGFRQNNDLFYLSGIDQEETILIISPGGKETLFIKETSELIKIWEGAKLTKEEAQKLSGIHDVRWVNEYNSFITGLISDHHIIYTSENAHARANNQVETRNSRLLTELKKKIDSNQRFESVSSIMHDLRYVKEREEVQSIQTACNITEKAFRRVLNFIKPGVQEYEVEAEITHEFLMNRSRGHAYSPIVASGANACVLHYVENNATCNDGDLVLMDFGAEYGNYNADLTRSIPVNGRFTERQKAVYNAVLHVHNEAAKLLVPGNTFEILNKEVAKLMESELIGLGLLDQTDVKNQDPKKPLFRQYFMHGTSHSLGLDVHDVDNRAIPFEEGMVFTCEPGIYIPKENLGIRIENDIVLTKDGNLDLMKNIPIEVEDIEDLMNS